MKDCAKNVIEQWHIFNANANYTNRVSQETVTDDLQDAVVNANTSSQDTIVFFSFVTRYKKKRTIFP